MEKLLVVDGSNLLFQMFFGMPARITNQKGEAIQGVLGFVGALLKILRMVKPPVLMYLWCVALSLAGAYAYQGLLNGLKQLKNKVVDK